MFTVLSPIWILVAVFLGGVCAPILGWARAKLDAQKAGAIEPFDFSRLIASSIIAAIAAVLFFSQYSTALSVAFPDVVLAFVAGFGADKIVKNAVGI